MEITSKIGEGKSSDNTLATLKFKCGKTEEAVIKGSNSNFVEKRFKKWRETIFYTEILTENMRETVKCPQIYFGIANKAHGGQLLVM
jgi:hypothetical protein